MEKTYLKNWKVPFFDVSFDSKEQRAANTVIKSGWLSAGPFTDKFEENFKKKINYKYYSLAVSSATSALKLALRCINIKKGDEVILPSLTFVSCANVILQLGGKPVFADIISPENWTICANDISKKITKKTKVIMLVHYAGFSCEIDKIKKKLKNKKIKIIEDCSHAIFNKYDKNNYLGSFGDYACFSFYSNKNITTGEGGMLLVKEKKKFEYAKKMRTHGISNNAYSRLIKKKFSYDVIGDGYNFRFDEIRSAIGLEQLKKIDKLNSKRLKLYNTYIREIEKRKLNIFIPFKKEKTSSIHIFPILIPRYILRSSVVNYLTKKKIQTSLHYPPIHKFSFLNQKKLRLKQFDSISKSMLSLPFYPSMKKNQLTYVVKELANAINKKKNLGK